MSETREAVASIVFVVTLAVITFAIAANALAIEAHEGDDDALIAAMVVVLVGSLLAIFSSIRLMKTTVDQPDAAMDTKAFGKQTAMVFVPLFVASAISMVSVVRVGEESAKALTYTAFALAALPLVLFSGMSIDPEGLKRRRQRYFAGH
jgi:cellobiose-specific phosphotransferase system component IIC